MKLFTATYIIFVLCLIFSSCSKKETAENSMPDLSQANNMNILFKMDFDSTNKMKIKTVPISDAKKMTEIKTLLSSEPFPYVYCSSTGALNFYKDSALLYSFAFNTDTTLRHIAYNYNNKLIAVTLSDDNAKYLESFKK